MSTFETYMRLFHNAVEGVNVQTFLHFVAHDEMKSQHYLSLLVLAAKVTTGDAKAQLLQLTRRAQTAIDTHSKKAGPEPFAVVATNTTLTF